jgi:23S rRNA (uridine2552-2'-O)-methyltransferase
MKPAQNKENPVKKHPDKKHKFSKQWMREHVNDPFVQLAQKEGYRSRAAYKLLEIDAKDRLLKPGTVVVDLGATPGGWSQVAAARVGRGGKVIALDLLPLVPMAGVDFIQGDFREQAVLKQLEDLLQGKPVGLVISDMAPNISGVSSADQARAMHLAELALEFALEHLKPDGSFLVKVFQGAGFEEFLKLMRSRFARVVTRKPKASRDRSSEVYLLGSAKLEK